MKFLKLALVLAFFSVKSVLAINIPGYSGRVNDFANIFSSQFRQDLEQKLADIETATTNQITVVTISSLQNTTIEDYAEQLFQKWGIGQKKKDNGLLLLIAPGEREVRLEVGYGLEPIITDGRAGEIIRNQLTPEFKKGDYEKGTLLAINKINSYFSDNPVANKVKTKDLNDALFSIIFILFFILPYFFSYLARSKEFYLGGIVGVVLGCIAGFILVSLTVGLISAMVLGILGFILDFILSKNYKKLKSLGYPTGFWSSRGGFGGGSSGGGGFGGFGGGSSGGGGASGKW